jgi:DNA-directed RNA polymerase subunit RPC12/RpoP
MGERKVIQKYYPPDFDPSKIPRAKKPKNQAMTVRMMLPMSVRCTACGDFLGKGKKFNSRKELVLGEDYLGIKIFRFYIKCTKCSSEFTIKTNPKDGDYTAEAGCTRNFEPWKENKEAEAAAKAERAKEEEGDVMKALENRTKDSKREMDVLDALDELKSRNANANNLEEGALWDQHKKTFLKPEEDEDEAIIQGLTFKGGANYVRRLEDEEEDEGLVQVAKRLKSEERGGPTSILLSEPQKDGPVPAPKPAVKSQLPVVKVIVKPKAAAPAPSEGLSALGDYGSD